MLFSMVLLSMSLSVDSLFLGLAYGASKTKINWKAKAVICLCSVVYAAIALLIGHWFTLFIPEEISKVIGACLLGIIGVMMVVRSFKNAKNGGEAAEKVPSEDEKRSKTFEIVLKSIVITIDVTKNPKKADLDNSGDIDLKEALLIGSALSIDSLSVGIGSALIGLNAWYLALLIGFFQLVFLSLGLYLTRFTKALFHSEKRSMLATGILLILIGIIRCI